MRAARSNILVWFGVLGGAFAWAGQHVANIGLGFARCNSPDARHQVALHPWAIVLTVAGVLVVLLSEAAALATFRATREKGSKPPDGRVHFLATIGLTVNPLVAAIILMSGVGTLLLPLCHQS